VVNGSYELLHVGASPAASRSHDSDVVISLVENHERARFYSGDDQVIAFSDLDEVGSEPTF
jgi:hypothetical protein